MKQPGRICRGALPRSRGWRNDRLELAASLKLAKFTGATLVIAKLDRLSRDTTFLLTLRDSGVRFAACDMPVANDLTVGIMALVAEAERDLILKPTKEALAAATARGVHLGNSNGAAALRRAGKGGEAFREAVRENANAHARDLAPVIKEIQAQGCTRLRAIAAELNARGVLTHRGGRWHVSNVRNLLRRVETMAVKKPGAAGMTSANTAKRSPFPVNQ